MPGSLTLEMVTPERVALEKKAEFVVLPAENGEMGVLPGHESFLVRLAPGEVRVTADGEVEHFVISGGFAEIKDNRISLFAETAEMAAQIDTEQARQALEKAKALSQRTDLDPLTLAAAEAAIRNESIRLRLSGLRRQPRRQQPK